MKRLTTDRLLLRPLTLEDAGALNRLNADPQVMRYIGPLQDSVEKTRRYLMDGPMADYHKYGFGRHAMLHRASGEFIGFCGLKYLPELDEVDVGYRLLPAYWGQGLVTEAARETMRFGREDLGLKRIIGLAMPDNQASIRVLEKLGMQYEKQVTHLDTECVCYCWERGE